MSMNKFLVQHDLVYERAPAEWLDGIPLGNGDMGVVIWGNGAPLTLTLDKCDVWETRYPDPHDPRYNYETLRKLIEEKREGEAKAIFERLSLRDNAPHTTRLPMPRMVVDLGEAAMEFSARLALHDAVAKGEMVFSRGRAAWTCFVHADKNLLVFEIIREAGIAPPRAAIDTESLNLPITNHARFKN